MKTTFLQVPVLHKHWTRTTVPTECLLLPTTLTKPFCLRPKHTITLTIRRSSILPINWKLRSKSETLDLSIHPAGSNGDRGAVRLPSYRLGFCLRTHLRTGTPNRRHGLETRRLPNALGIGETSSAFPILLCLCSCSALSAFSFLAQIF